MKKYILPAVLLIALVATGVWGYYQYNERNDYHTYLDIQFQRQFYDLIGHVENVQVDLAKAMVSGSNRDMVKFLNDTIQQTYMAQEKLTQLPFYHGSIRQTEKFLSQLGDYCTAMVNKSLEGIVVEGKELDTLEELHNYANYLSQELINLQQEVVKGGVNFGDLRHEGNENLEAVNDKMKDLKLINIEERMQDYPELIYDGPFSEHIKDVKAKLTGESIDEPEAIKILEEQFQEQGIVNGRVVGKIENASVNGFYLKADKTGNNGGQEVSAAISQIGGKIIWYLNPREIGDSKLSREEAFERAEDFLEKQDYESMTATYAMAAEGEIVINFAYEQEDVIVYTDLIKVKVALDNGEIIGFETEGFLVNHHEREIPEPKITESAAKERLSSGVEIEDSRLAIIPIAGRKEALCYEFKVKFGEDNYLIYIDAADGEQRTILLMIEQEDGTLVI